MLPSVHLLLLEETLTRPPGKILLVLVKSDVFFAVEIRGFADLSAFSEAAFKLPFFKGVGALLSSFGSCLSTGLRDNCKPNGDYIINRH